MPRLQSVVNLFTGQYARMVFPKGGVSSVSTKVLVSVVSSYENVTGRRLEPEEKDAHDSRSLARICIRVFVVIIIASAYHVY